MYMCSTLNFAYWFYLLTSMDTRGGAAPFTCSAGNSGWLLTGELVRATLLRHLSAQVSRKNYLLATFTPLGQRYGISHALVHSVLLIIFLFILFFRFLGGLYVDYCGNGRSDAGRCE